MFWESASLLAKAPTPFYLLTSSVCLWVLVSRLSCSTCCLFDCSMGWVLIVLLVCVFLMADYISYLSHCWNKIPSQSNSRKKVYFLAHNWRCGAKRDRNCGRGVWGGFLYCTHIQEAEMENGCLCPSPPSFLSLGFQSLKGVTHIQGWSSLIS